MHSYEDLESQSQRDKLIESERQMIGCAPITASFQKVTKALGQGDLKAMVVGGYAVQHHGYPRFTSDLDLVVNDVAEVRDYLSMRGFQEVPGTTTILKDRSNGVTIDLMPAGGKVGH